jgi:hypothetical protein
MRSIVRFLQAPRRGPSFVNLLGELLAITNRRLCERDLTSLCSRSCETTRVVPKDYEERTLRLTEEVIAALKRRRRVHGSDYLIFGSSPVICHGSPFSTFSLD